MWRPLTLIAGEPLGITARLGIEPVDSNSPGNPVDVDAPVSDGDAEEIGAIGKHLGAETSHSMSLPGVDGVDRVPRARDRPHLDHHPGGAIAGDDVDLTRRCSQVPSLDLETPVGEPPCGEPLPGGS